MIQANELRIGNYFNYSHIDGYVLKELIYIKIETINEDYVTDNTHSVINLSELKPIPLTEELLLKCGFEYKSDFDAYVINQNKSNEIIINRKDFILCDIHIRINLKYLQQLQNLYFALTGTELEINL